MGAFYSDVGPVNGPVMYRDVAGTIGVFADPDGSEPIGRARCIGWDAAGSAVWRLAIEDEEFEDPWIIVDREFLSTMRDWRDLYRSDFHPDLHRRAATSGPHGRRGVRRTGALKRPTTTMPTPSS